MSNAIERLFNDMIWPTSTETYPRYNIAVVDTDTLIEVSVLGRGKDDIEVTLESERLFISCAKLPETGDRSYLRKDLTGKGFQLLFIVSRAAEVKEVKLKNGLLSILIGKPKSNPLRIEVQSND